MGLESSGSASALFWHLKTTLLFLVSSSESQQQGGDRPAGFRTSSAGDKRQRCPCPTNFHCRQARCFQHKQPWRWQGCPIHCSDSCMGRTGKYHREQSLNCSSRISEGAFISERSSGSDAWHSGLLSCYDWQAGDFFV